ncbi:hypothetical protein C1H57_17370 [Clostridium sp. 2-1]|uniref:hypothetical protein n=1 Tax=Clostridium TaxID=1485 RepID=UPI000CDBA270|nr:MULTISPECIES: hypothetical protein [Clostridium]MBN7576231.1 hypothetical protein [Clostridium beijerinckii]MBN7581313.1 hypothetical protein [Clostridium beijerinckii]MBN7586000.1 hypothetical protein [Clostridium beijerinckii]MBO0521933.1 hypothetical protein [Clostridium beijerinckii]POO90030.1 hypothetical protein C1H57_17370 [Clostridium sp. 2-1]
MSIVTIITSILCAIVFNYLIKPMLDRKGFTLDIQKLIQENTDKTYKTIAKDFNETPSILCLSYMDGILFGIIIVIILISIASRVNLNLTQVVDNNSNVIQNFMLGYFLFAIWYLFLQLNQLKYINSAIVHYKQLLKIITPNISKEDFDKYESQFARIQSKNDYVTLIAQLVAICSTNKIELPQFKIK